MENLRAIRKARKMTQEDLASLVGVSASAISQYESGGKTPSFETALKLAEALDCESSDLVTSRTGLIDAVEKGNKKPATNEGDGEEYSISDEDRKFLKWFRSLPEGKQRAILISQDAPAELL